MLSRANHHLQEISLTKETYKKYIKDEDDMKSVKAKLEERRLGKVKPIMRGSAEETQYILANFKTTCCRWLKT